MAEPFFPIVPLISLELTNHCNLRCPYCGNRNMTRPRGYMEWGLLEKIVADCRQGGHQIQGLHGAGEPLLYPRLEEAIRLVKDNTTGALAIFTNGVLLTPDKAQKLLSAGVDAINVSLDSLDPKVYAATRGADLAKVVENIRNLIRLAPSTVLIYIDLMNSKVQELSEREIRLFHETFGTRDNVVLWRVENSFFPVADFDYRITPERKTSCCLPASIFSIAWDGRVWLCCLDQDVQHSLGNLDQESIAGVWLDQKNQEALYKLALGELGCPEYCLHKCTLTIDPAIGDRPDFEIDLHRARKLLEIANGLPDDWTRYSLRPEFFVQRALEIAPDQGEIQKMWEALSQKREVTVPVESHNSRFLSTLKRLMATLVRKSH